MNSKEQLKKEADELVKKVKQDAKEWDEAFSGKTKFTKEMDERFRRAAEYAMKERKKRHNLESSGLKQMSVQVAVFWNKTDGWQAKVCFTEEDLMHCGSFGDFAGSGTVACVVPKEAKRQ